jgi:hypothetical protein
MLNRMNSPIKLLAAAVLPMSVVLCVYAQVKPGQRQKDFEVPASAPKISRSAFVVPQSAHRAAFRRSAAAHTMTLQEVSDQVAELEDQVAALQTKLAEDERTIDDQEILLYRDLAGLRQVFPLTRLLPPADPDGTRHFEPFWTQINLPQSVENGGLGITNVRVMSTYGWVYLDSRDPNTKTLHNLPY